MVISQLTQKLLSKRHIYRVFLITLSCIFVSSVIGAERWQLVILPDRTYESAPELADMHNTIAQRLTNALSNADFDVFDQLSVGLPNCIVEDCKQLSDQRLRDMAARSGKELNLAMLYQIIAVKQPGTTIDKWQFNLSARLLDLESGTQQDAFDVEGKFNETYSECKGECFRGWLAKNVSGLAQDLGTVLSEKLHALPRRYRFGLTIENFTPGELQQIDLYLKELPGYVADKLQREYNASNQLFHQVGSRDYRYVSELSGSGLRAQLETFSSKHGVPVQVSYRSEQRSFQLTRNGMPYMLLYIGVICALLLLSYAVFASWQRQTHQRQLDKLGSEGKAQQWLNYFVHTGSIFSPRKKTWFDEEKIWLNRIKEAKQLSQQAWLLVDQYQYDAANEKLDAALKLDQGCEEAQALKLEIVDYKRGFERMLLAQQEVETHPASAMKLLAEAKQLNPRLLDKIAPIEQRCIELIQEHLGKDALHKAQSAFTQGNIYQAYSIIDKAIASIGGLSSFVKEQAALAELRQQLDQQTPVLTNAVVGTAGLSGCYIYTNPIIQLGRTAAEPHSSVVISYKRVSRTGKQTQILRQDGQYFLSDMGSSNGTHYNGQLLTAGSKIKCNNGGLLALGAGLQAGSAGPCQLDTKFSISSPGSMVLRLSSGVLKFIDDTNIGQAWPSIDEDLSKLWVLIEHKVALGITEQGSIDVGCVNNTSAIANLVYDKGYYIEPANAQSEISNITVDQQSVFGRVPLQHGVSVQIANVRFQLMEIQ